MSDAAAVPLTPTLEGQPTTRRRLLQALKRLGEASAETLAEQLDITVSGVRQHLSGLTSAGLVEHREAHGGSPGRPRHLYRLTATAEALFPKTYGELTNELLDYVAQEDPALLERVFDRRRARRVELARTRLEGKSFDERIAELARILDEEGYLADFERQPDGAYRITEHNCAILGVAQRHARACSSELQFLRESLPDASVRRVAHMIAGEHICRYEIAPRER